MEITKLIGELKIGDVFLHGAKFVEVTSIEYTPEDEEDMEEWIINFKDATGTPGFCFTCLKDTKITVYPDLKVFNQCI